MIMSGMASCLDLNASALIMGMSAKFFLQINCCWQPHKFIVFDPFTSVLFLEHTVHAKWNMVKIEYLRRLLTSYRSHSWLHRSTMSSMLNLPGSQSRIKSSTLMSCSALLVTARLTIRFYGLLMFSFPSSDHNHRGTNSGFYLPFLNVMPTVFIKLHIVSIDVVPMLLQQREHNHITAGCILSL